MLPARTCVGNEGQGVPHELPKAIRGCVPRGSRSWVSVARSMKDLQVIPVYTLFKPCRSVPVHPFKGGGTWNAGTDRRRGGPATWNGRCNGSLERLERPVFPDEIG